MGQEGREDQSSGLPGLAAGGGGVDRRAAGGRRLILAGGRRLILAGGRRLILAGGRVLMGKQFPFAVVANPPERCKLTGLFGLLLFTLRMIISQIGNAATGGSGHASLITHPLVIVAFAVVVIIMLMLDLGVFNRKSHVVGTKEAGIWTLVWISLSMAFSAFIYFMSDGQTFTEFQTAYWIEKALSVDNLFVFILVFGYFNVARENHHKVLFWGIIGALVLRGIFIFSGVGLIKLTFLPDFWIFSNEGDPVDGNGLPIHEQRLNILLTLFGGFLIYAGIKSLFVSDDDDEEKDFSKSPGARFVHKLFKVSKEFDGNKFFTIENGVKLATPLLVVVGVIEFTDLLFAVDSIPAIFAVSSDPFVLYTSNIFAILGLRSMYFLLSNFIHMFSKLKYGLGIILSFIGVKMVIAPIFHLESWISLLIVGGVLVLSLLASLVFPEKKEDEEGEQAGKVEKEKV
jgi:tellurite resistance protein TerC